MDDEPKFSAAFEARIHLTGMQYPAMTTFIYVTKRNPLLLLNSLAATP
jgi:hypothetical protein